jgi:Skp family chaperone for outer membrane proteins
MLKRYLFPGAIACLLMISLNSHSYTQQWQGVTPVVGVCNVQKVLAGLDEWKDVNTSLQADKANATNELNAKKAKINQLNDDLTLLKPDSKEYTQKATEIENATIEADVYTRIADATMSRKEKQKFKELMDKMNIAIKDVAKMKQFDIVLNDFSQDIPDLEKLDFSQLHGLEITRTILCSENRLDVTQDVIIQMNKSYGGQQQH